MDQCQDSINPLKAILHLPASTQCVFINWIVGGRDWSVGHSWSVGPLDLDQRVITNRGLPACLTIEAVELGA